jgi:hypothetical protein
MFAYFSISVELRILCLHVSIFQPCHSSARNGGCSIKRGIAVARGIANVFVLAVVLVIAAGVDVVIGRVGKGNQGLVRKRDIRWCLRHLFNGQTAYTLETVPSERTHVIMR